MTPTRGLAGGRRPRCPRRRHPRHGERDGLPWLQPLRTRAALGLTPVVAPAVLFVPIGAVLGPSFTNVLSPAALGYLDAVVAVALAVLGVFAGLALDLRGQQDRRLFTAASVEAIVTLLFVGGAFLVLLVVVENAAGAVAGLVALTLGLCASVSSAGSADQASPTHAIAAGIADLDDVLPIVVSGVLVVMLGSASPLPIWSAVAWVFRTIVLGIAVGTAGWLLFERAHSRAERNVFIAGIVALIGGTSSFLGLSPLLAGLMAGLLWVWLPGHADRVVRSDLQRVQHPLIVVLLLVAGASCEFSREAVWLSGPARPLQADRQADGRLAGDARAGPRHRQRTRACTSIAPGLLGIAVALHLLQVVRTPGMTAVLTAVVAATLASEALALLLRPPRSRRRDAPARARDHPRHDRRGDERCGHRRTRRRARYGARDRLRADCRVADRRAVRALSPATHLRATCSSVSRAVRTSAPSSRRRWRASCRSSTVWRSP